MTSLGEDFRDEGLSPFRSPSVPLPFSFRYASKTTCWLKTNTCLSLKRDQFYPTVRPFRRDELAKTSATTDVAESKTSVCDEPPIPYRSPSVMRVKVLVEHGSESTLEMFSCLTVTRFVL